MLRHCSLDVSNVFKDVSKPILAGHLTCAHQNETALTIATPYIAATKRESL